MVKNCLLLVKQKEKEKKKQEEKQGQEFKELMKLYLEQLISIFYPVQIVWYEMVVMIIMGLLFGLGLGYIVKFIMIYYGVIPWK